MKLFAPKYYKDFVCIADKCKHSCCVGWEIDIDSETLNKYANLSCDYSKVISSSISYEGTPHFRLTEGEKCPHLDNLGLCNIIKNLGEGYLCDICREHPRFYNNCFHRKEVGVGMACEEAARIILNSDDYGVFVPVGELCGEEIIKDFDVRVPRGEVFGILSDRSIGYNDKLIRIYEKFNVSPDLITDNQWREIISALEYLDEEHEVMLSKYSSDLVNLQEYEKYLERALAYFVFRHCTSAQDIEEFRVSLGFCLFCERLLASMFKAFRPADESDIIRIAQIISEEIEYSEDNTEDIKFEFSLIP